jgi:hypothetical protein
MTNVEMENVLLYTFYLRWMGRMSEKLTLKIGRTGLENASRQFGYSCCARAEPGVRSKRTLETAKASKGNYKISSALLVGPIDVSDVRDGRHKETRLFLQTNIEATRNASIKIRCFQYYEMRFDKRLGIILLLNT